VVLEPDAAGIDIGAEEIYVLSDACSDSFLVLCSPWRFTDSRKSSPSLACCYGSKAFPISPFLANE
jgi:hypothetical protein